MEQPEQQEVWTSLVLGDLGAVRGGDGDRRRQEGQEQCSW